MASTAVTSRSGRTTGAGAAGRLVGAVGAVAGAAAWGLGVAATDAARAAELALVEAGVQPGEDPSGVDSVGTVDLLLHDVRLGALVAVWTGLALVVTARPGRPARLRGPVLLGGAAALAVGNAVIGALLGAGPVQVVVGALGLLGLTAAGCAAGAAAGQRRVQASSAGPRRTWHLVPAGAAAGTAGALGVNGIGDGWAYLLVDTAVAAAALAAATLAVVAAVGVLLVPDLGPWWRWPLAVVAAAPGVVSVGALLPGGSFDDLVLLVVAPVAFVLVAGGVVSMAITAPAGAVIGVDGLPLVGGGTMIGLLVGLLLSGVLPTRGRGAAAAAPAERVDGLRGEDRGPTVTP